MTKCPHCGCENDINNVICLNCGSYLEISTIKNKNVGLSLFLAAVLPGIAYFYLEQYYRGILYFSLLFSVIFSLALFTAFYGPNRIIEEIYINSVFSSFICLYILQIYDVIKRTKLINDGIIRFKL